ncbi:hypothetical protein [Actinoallomurus vinaceus]|uniref:hypothetical protein n=1 Tax=Actinoallomurus vinaceus TaxID=1080074 RepID=UPI003CD068F1
MRDRGLNEALLGSHAAGAALAEQRRAHAEAFAQLVERARHDGAVRQQGRPTGSRWHVSGGRPRSPRP